MSDRTYRGPAARLYHARESALDALLSLESAAAAEALARAALPPDALDGYPKQHYPAPGWRGVFRKGETRNGGQLCDNPEGHCSCGARHYRLDWSRIEGDASDE